MPERRDPPPTEEGWFVHHDFRRIEWDAWRAAPQRDRERALDEASEFMTTALAVEDSEDGASALYSILGDKADLLIVHMRPTSAELGSLERRFETTAFARFTERVTSFVSVTEASGYSERAREYFEGDLDESSGLAKYMEARLEPTVPDATHVCFYPMDKRRDPEQNWYDLPFEERADHMEAHGEIGRDYGGKVTQMITGAIALDDWEWGVTLWGEDLTDMKDLLYEMRFDPSTSQYADFGPFYIGRRLPPEDLPAFLAGEPIPTAKTTDRHAEGGPVHPADATEESAGHWEDTTDAHPPEADHGDEPPTDDPSTAATPSESPADEDHPDPPTGDGDVPSRTEDDPQARLGTLGLHAGDEYTPGDYGLVVYSEAEAQKMADEVDSLRGNFEHYDSHVTTVVRAEGGRSAVISVWDSERAADTAAGFLTDLPGVSEVVRGPLGEASDVAEGGPATRDEDVTRGIRDDLADLDIYAGKPHGEDVYALVLYSRAEPAPLVDAVADLCEEFGDRDAHETTDVYEDPDSDTLAVTSHWESAEAAQGASDALTDLPGVVGWAGESDGFGTMGMFYTVEPDHREEFVGTFADVGEMLAEMGGHRESALMVNLEDENDMFIASQWDSKADAMEFFRSEAFAETVEAGREMLADRPRHVFLA